MSRDDSLLGALRTLHRKLDSPEASPDFEKRIMRDVRRIAATREDEEEKFSTALFLRLSFASLFAAVMLNASVSFAPFSEQASLERIEQIDPFEIGGDLDE